MYTIRNAADEIEKSVRAYLRKNGEGRYCMKETQRLPMLLIGAPGIGKTEVVESIAKRLGIGFASLSITHYTKNNLLGLPVIRDHGDIKTTEYTMSEMLDMVYEQKKKGYDEGILLIDEFNCMSESLLPTMLAFTQTKNIGKYSLPEGWVMVMCANPPEYNRSARNFDIATMDRLRVMKVDFSAEDFLSYAKENKLNAAVIQYLETKPENVYNCELMANGTRSIVTCRGWANLSESIDGYEAIGENVTEEMVSQFIKNESICADFYEFYMIVHSGIDEETVEDIWEGRNLTRHIDRFVNDSFEQKLGIAEYMADKLIAECSVYAEEDKVTYLHKDMERSNEALSNLCTFIEGIDSEDEVMEAFMNRINASIGVQEMVINLRNDEYMAANGRLYGIDEFLGRLGKKIG